MPAKIKVASFLYHDVSDDCFESGFQRRSAVAYKQSREVFARHLDRIASSPVTPELVTGVDFQRSERHVLLTFDDGGKGALHASDELNRRGWKAHFFITTSLIGSRTFLDAGAIRYLRGCGHIIGSHSHTHPDIFKSLPFDEMIREWRISCDLLSALLGEPSLAGSVPGGDISQSVLQSASDAGMQYLFTSDPCLVPKRVGACWILGRVCPKAHTSLPNVQRLAQFRGWTKELVVSRLKATMKRALFPLYRVYVQRALQ